MISFEHKIIKDNKNTFELKKNNTKHLNEKIKIILLCKWKNQSYIVLINIGVKGVSKKKCFFKDNST